MKIFGKIVVTCCLCFISVIAGLYFAKGNIGMGIFCIGGGLLINLPTLVRDEDDE